MHLDRFMLGLVIAGVTIAVLGTVALYVVLALHMPIWVTLGLGIMLGIVAYIGGSLVISRLNNPEEDHYNRMKH